MKIFELNGLNKARVWFESDDKFLIQNNSERFFFKFECNKSLKIENQSIILELFLPRGGRIVYGALGVDYKYIAQGFLSVNVHESNIRKKTFDESLINPVEKAYVGLPVEYSKAVYLELDKLHREKKLPIIGELNFSYAVYSDVSSSEWVFQRLTYVLINLLQNTKENITKEKLIDLLGDN